MSERADSVEGAGGARRSFALLGSGEFEAWTEPADRWMLARSAHPDGPVLILPTASAPEGEKVFGKWADMGLTHYRELGIPAEVLPLKTKEDAERDDFGAKLETAAMVYFSGGNPGYLAETLLGSSFWMRLLEAMEDGVGYSGCSAGIASLGDVAPDSANRTFDDSMWRPGLSLFPGTLLGPHWDMLEAFVPGLQKVIVDAVPPGKRLLAIDERTAVVGDGTDWQIMGMGKARLLDTGGAWQEWEPGRRFTLPLVS